MLIVFFILTGYWPFPNEVSKANKNIGKPIKQLQENDKLKRYKQHLDGRWYFEDSEGFIHVLNVEDGIITGIEYTTNTVRVLEVAEAKSNIGKPIKQLQENDKLERYKEHGNEEWYFEDSEGWKKQLYVEDGILTKVGDSASKSLFSIEWYKLNKNIGKPIEQLQENDRLKRYKEYSNGWWYFVNSAGDKYRLYVENGILTKIGSSLKRFVSIELRKVGKNIGKPIKQLQESDKLKRYKEYSNGWWYFEDSDGYILLLYVEDGILVGSGERIKYVLLNEMGKIYKNIGKPIKQLQETVGRKRCKKEFHGRWNYRDSEGITHSLNVVDGILIGIRENSGIWVFPNLNNKATFKSKQAEEPRVGNDNLENINERQMKQ